METQHLSACLMLLENFKAPLHGYSNMYKATWSDLTCNISKGRISLVSWCIQLSPGFRGTLEWKQREPVWTTTSLYMYYAYPVMPMHCFFVSGVAVITFNLPCKWAFSLSLSLETGQVLHSSWNKSQSDPICTRTAVLISPWHAEEDVSYFLSSFSIRLFSFWSLLHTWGPHSPKMW